MTLRTIRWLENVARMELMRNYKISLIRNTLRNTNLQLPERSYALLLNKHCRRMETDFVRLGTWISLGPRGT